MQNVAYKEQVDRKENTLRELLARTLQPPSPASGAPSQPPRPQQLLPTIQCWPSPQPYGYRNRIRLRVRQHEGQLRLGYSIRGTRNFLPVTMCPIAAPLLWRAAEALMATAQSPGAAARDLVRWLETTAEAELFCDGEQTRVQLTLLSTSRAPRDIPSFARAMESVRNLCPELTNAAFCRYDPQSGRALDALAQWGTPGMPYPLLIQDHTEIYWITRGGFFQVNRFLLPTLANLVCNHRSGRLAWDLFAGVGLFSRILARRFAAVTAVEANPIAAADLTRVLARLGVPFRAVQAATLEFLRRAVIERDRPDVIVLDPPRAGAGEEACRLLARIAAPEIVYLSCDPETLARDLAILTTSGYTLSALHLIDLFPQTLHIETLAILHRA